MLVSLKIKNLAVIEEVSIGFHKGFNVLTGETGVGKSMVVTALGLLLGAKAAPLLLRTGQDEGLVEAVLRLQDGREVTLTRVISRVGRSRAYVDGKAVGLSELLELSRPLIDIYGQGQHYLLKDPHTHLDFLDQWGGSLGLRRVYQEAFERYRALEREIEALEKKRAEAWRKKEFLTYQIQELERVDLKTGEEEALKRKRQELIGLQRTMEILQKAAQNVETSLKELHSASKELSKLEGVLPFGERLKEVQMLLEDLSFEIVRQIERFRFDPVELEKVEARLYELEKLKKKYGVKEAEELKEALEALREELRAYEGLDEQIEKLFREKAGLAKELLELARSLSLARKEAAVRLSHEMRQSLKELGMGFIEFAFAFSPPESDFVEVEGVKLGPLGAEEGEFVFSANPGELPKPLSLIASGGELSRTMLALKGLFLKEGGKVLVFDEVDTGIGGETAQVVGRKLKELSKRHQLLCVTHLPQIAVFADWHLRVRKEIRGERTTVVVEPVEGEERKKEIARMLAGGMVTEVTLRQAEELLKAGWA